MFMAILSKPSHRPWLVAIFAALLVGGLLLWLAA